MPLDEGLLNPIPGDNPSGKNLRYDQVFEQLKEARFEEEEGIPEGQWARAKKKKADRRLVVKIASDALAKRSKDLNLAAYLVESLVHLDGYSIFAPALDLLRELQERFWTTLYPEVDENDDFEMRAVAVSKAVRGMGQALLSVPLTSSGFCYSDYLESRTIGYEKDATTDAKKAARKDAVDHGKLTAEDFDKAFAASPKLLYSEGEAALTEALNAIDRLDTYQREAYKDNEPSLRELRPTVEAVHQVVEYLLNERRKTEPDPVAEADAPAPGEEGEAPEPATDAGAVPPPKSTILRKRTSEGAPKTAEDAYAQVVESALYLFEITPVSPVPYLICAGLRTGETAMQEAQPAPGFAVAPDTGVRMLLRNLAASSNWVELLRESLPLLASECARGWLDLHWYVHKAAVATGAPALAIAVQGTVKNLLTVRPELRNWTLEDDTGTANPETRKWLDSL